MNYDFDTGEAKKRDAEREYLDRKRRDEADAERRRKEDEETFRRNMDFTNQNMMIATMMMNATMGFI